MKNRSIPPILLLMAAVLASSAVALRGQSAGPPAGTAVIVGRVVDGTTKRPVPGATVTLTVDSGEPIGMWRRPPTREVMADEQGQFVLDALPEGRYQLSARRTGWNDGVYRAEQPIQVNFPNQAAPPDVMQRFAFALRAGQRLDVSVPMWRYPVLRGRVTVESGEPLANARVLARRWTVVMGRRVLSGPMATTDGQGRFDIPVAPGEYLISANGDDGRPRGAAASQRGRRAAASAAYFPSGTDVSGASVVDATWGNDREGLDIRLPLAPVWRVTGTLRSVDGAALPARIALTSADAAQPSLPVVVAQPLLKATAVDPSGRFVFDGVPNGTYTIATTAAGVVIGRDNGSWVRARVEIDGADRDVAVEVHPSLRVSGRVQFEGASQDASPVNVFLTLDTDPGGGDAIPPSFPVDSSGRFTANVNPGRYIVGVAAPGVRGRSAEATRAGQGWRLRSAMSGSRDVADAPLVVTRDVSDLVLTLTRQRAEVRGRVSNVQNDVDDVSVALFSADESLWVDYGPGRRHRLVRPGADGAFAVNDLPGGEYYLCAVRGIDQREWRAGAFFDVLATVAARVTLNEGAVTTRDVAVVPVPALRPASLRSPVSVLDAIDVAENRADGAVGSRGVSDPVRGSISGLVVDADTNRPIAGARVSLQGVEPPVDAHSDESGRFVMTDVPPGRHTIDALKDEYVPAVYGARRLDEPATPVAVAAGQRVAEILFPIERAAAVTVTVVDQNGEPMSNVEIGVRQDRWQPHGRELVPLRTVRFPAPSVTDSRGQLRVSGLPQGRYVVDARRPDNAPVGLVTQAAMAAVAGSPSTRTAPLEKVAYAPVSHPDAAEVARGTRLQLAAGEERTVSLRMDLVRVAEVKGVVRGPDGPLARAVLQLNSHDPVAGFVMPLGFGPERPNPMPLPPSSPPIFADAMGQFTVTGVLPGQYTLTTRPLSSFANTSRPNLWGAVDVTVHGDVEGVRLDLHPAQALSGRLHMVGSTAPPALTNVLVMASRIGGAATPADVTTVSWDAEGRFTFANLRPGRYRLSLIGRRGVVTPTIVAQTVAGKDTLNSGVDLGPGSTIDTVDITVAATPLQVTGTVRRVDGQVAKRVVVVLFARESAAWASPAVRVFATQPDQSGKFIFNDVPPGSYWIAPVVDVEPNEWFDPALLATLTTSARPVMVSRATASDVALVVP